MAFIEVFILLRRLIYILFLVQQNMKLIRISIQIILERLITAEQINDHDISTN